jgi:hypothetical protein
MRNAAQKIGRATDLQARTWQSLTVDGTIVIDNILKEIDSSEYCMFDVTYPNENVLFETGYAIARAKKVVLSLDQSDQEAFKSWNDLGILKPIGYTGYQNSTGLAERFSEIRSGLAPVYDYIIEPAITDIATERAILYCSTFSQFEASNRLSDLLYERRRRGLGLVVSDPTESTLESISWYAPKINSAAGVLVHFAGPRRERAQVHNRRHAFVAGLATGLDVPTLLLAEEDYHTPFDYEIRTRRYDTSAACLSIVREWLEKLQIEPINWSHAHVNLRSRLAGIRFGEHVAENELTDLADYFVPTSAYQEVVEARDALFVGNRGTGKTANAIQAFEKLDSNKTNLAVLIKPPGFEFPALLDAVSKVSKLQQDYFFDSLWRFIVQTEIAATLLRRLDLRPAGVPRDAHESCFLDYATLAPFDIRADMSVRLNQALNHILESIDSTPAAENSGRDLINEAFHAKALEELRHHLGLVLKDKKRVAVFVDNLDKGWEGGADFPILAKLILGLLTARGRLVSDFNREDSWRDRIKLTVAVFLRSDIFNYVRVAAREPDKLPVSRISWRDPKILLSVVESRFLHSTAAPSDTSELWSKYFCKSVHDIPTRDYITSTVLPRPRDVVYFCNLAVGRAIDRRNEQVEAEDFVSARDTYSQYAYEALLVENGVTIPEMETALLSLLSAPAIITQKQITENFALADVSQARHEPIMQKLIDVSFLGFETGPGRFEYPEIGSTMKKAAALAERIATSPENRRFSIHPAFHSFLDIQN